MNSRWLKIWKNFLSGGRARRVGVALSIAVIVLSAVMVVYHFENHSGKTVIDREGCRSDGIVIDRGEYCTLWTHVDPAGEVMDPVELLKVACDKHGFAPVFKDGVLVGIKVLGGQTLSNDSSREWGLWYVKKGECDFKKSDTYKINVSDYTVVSWAYTANGEKPTVAVDASGTSIYGHSRPKYVSALSPACKYLIGYEYDVEQYPEHYYPKHYEYEVIEPSSDRGDIMSKGHDIVLCDGSIPTHYGLADDLRRLGVDCVVTYSPKTLKDVANNIFIARTAVGWDASHVASSVDAFNGMLDDIKGKCCATKGYKTLVALSPDISPWVPWVAGGGFVDEVLTLVNGSNALDDIEYIKSANGWLQLTPSEMVKINPDCIVILDSRPLDGDEKGKFEEVMSSMPSEWKRTNAYKNNRIHLLTGEMGMIAQCAGPGTIPFAGLMASIVNPNWYQSPQ